MKTNVVMIREDQRFLQRTKDGYFNASHLIKSVKTSKSTRHYKSSKGTIEYIEQLRLEGIDNPYISNNKGVWLHPKLFIDFAMYVSVEFKSKVIDYVLDGLINSRNDAGDYYNEMSAVILDKYIEHKGTKPPATIYINEANRIKEILGLKGKNRNEMTEKELSSITDMQKLNAILISDNVGVNSRVKQLKTMARIYKKV